MLEDAPGVVGLGSVDRRAVRVDQRSEPRGRPLRGRTHDPRLAAQRRSEGRLREDRLVHLHRLLRGPGAEAVAVGEEVGRRAAPRSPRPSR